jgi:hypothetical protein
VDYNPVFPSSLAFAHLALAAAASLALTAGLLRRSFLAGLAFWAFKPAKRIFRALARALISLRLTCYPHHPTAHTISFPSPEERAESILSTGHQKPKGLRGFATLQNCGRQSHSISRAGQGQIRRVGFFALSLTATSQRRSVSPRLSFTISSITYRQARVPMWGGGGGQTGAGDLQVYGGPHQS